MSLCSYFSFLSQMCIAISGQDTSMNVENSQMKRFADSCLNFLSNLRESFVTADVRLKQKMLGSIFMENLVFDGENCRTPKLNPVIALFSNYNADFAKKEKGLNDPFFIQSPPAEREGLLPFVIPFVGGLASSKANFPLERLCLFPDHHKNLWSKKLK